MASEPAASSNSGSGFTSLLPSLQVLTQHPILSLLFLTFLTISTYALYNAYLHPLSSYPGPILWRSFRIPYVLATQRGILHTRLTTFHAHYGPVVRVAPNELSYATASALHDIYGNRGPTHLPFERNRTSFKKMTPDEPNSIVGWHEGDHARYRRGFAQAFSDRAVREQSAVVEAYVDTFMRELKVRAGRGEVVDLERWITYLLFDLSGDLTYGESWRCLEKGAEHPWVAIASDFGKGLALIGSINAYPPIDKLLRYIIPKRILKRSMDHRKMSQVQASKRIYQRGEEERKDWVTPTKKYIEAKGDAWTEKEWGINLLVVAFAGSETTASALTAIVRMLLQNKDVLHRLTEEIRGKFKKEEDIGVKSTGDLEYLNACVDEGLRLCPPVVIGIPRVVPKGGGYGGGGTYVTFNQFSAYRQSYNFPSPNDYLPERFLPPSPTTTIPPANPTIFHPFQLGRHQCIGQKTAMLEMRLVLARLLWTFDIRLKDEEDVWDWGEQATYILWDKRALEVVLVRVDGGGGGGGGGGRQRGG
ncbi:cytochrome P450 [Pyrenophora seminiperda CCB06]|uniref:Cytochrome P450 n=1 Tax=Pyrenophora seminiperda CCB06 TaxID=1302712 RepID=A0A3M7LZR3_9PLEO|nr:cytochrome P450 [Pyrenophora seminiperda CCB06]